MQKKSLETILYLGLGGVVIMLGILVALNFIVGFGRTRLDLTQENAFTLSSGTKAILKKLDTPVTIRFYCTQADATADEVYLKGYARKVEDLLAEYRQIAGSKLKIEKYDPQMDSDAEDSARLDGIEAKALAGTERFYMGLAVKCAIRLPGAAIPRSQPRAPPRIRPQPRHRPCRESGQTRHRRHRCAGRCRVRRLPLRRRRAGP